MFLDTFGPLSVIKYILQLKVKKPLKFQIVMPLKNQENFYFIKSKKIMKMIYYYFCLISLKDMRN